MDTDMLLLRRNHSQHAYGIVRTTNQIPKVEREKHSAQLSPSYKYIHCSSQLYSTVAQLYSPFAQRCYSPFVTTIFAVGSVQGQSPNAVGRKLRIVSKLSVTERSALHTKILFLEEFIKFQRALLIKPLRRCAHLCLS